MCDENCIITKKQLSSQQVLSCCFSTWSVECLPSALVRRWPLSCWMKNCDGEAEKIMCHSVLVPLLVSVQLHCMLFHKPSCKDQTRFKNTLRTINLVFQHWKRPFLQTNLKKNCYIYENHEKSFPSTHTFFLQSPNNNASIRFYFIYWHSKTFLAKIASLPWLRSPCIPGLEKHSAEMKSLTGCHQGIPFFISRC